MTYNLLRGSQWEKWDLHVHTPKSYLNNGFGDDWDLYVKTLYNKAIENGIKVIGITDYFTIEGYKKIKKDYLENLSKLNELFIEEIKEDGNYLDKVYDITLIPNIEFRLDKIVSSKKDGQQPRRLNYHVLLSNELSIEDIEENFLEELYFWYDGGVDYGPEKLKLKVSNLIKLGQKLKLEHAPFAGDKDIFVGCKNAVVALNEIVDKLKNSSIFKDKYLLIYAEDYMENIDWNGQDHAIRKIIVSSSHMIFSSNNKTREIALDDEYEKEFKIKRPCIWGSDAHSFDKLFKPDKDRYLWIKADPSFKGLRQLLIEPQDRVFIGEKPFKLVEVEKNKSYYIKRIKISPSNDSDKDKWFDSEIELNSGLITIIGNKGSGKSALADIIGYLAESSKYKYFSFLNPNRFNKPPEVIGEKYNGSIFWEDGTVTKKDRLSLEYNEGDVERVKYLPQNYIESVCNDLDDNFSREVNNMVFSYIDDNEKLGKDNFDDLIEYKCEEIDDEYNIILKELSEINRKIFNNEKLYNKNNIENIRKKIELKISEYNNHKKNKPIAVQVPKEREYEIKIIEDLNLKIRKIDDELEKISKIGIKNANKISEIDKISEKIENLRKEFLKSKNSLNEILGNIEFDGNITLELVIDIKLLQDFKEKLVEENNYSREKWHEINKEKKNLQEKKEVLINKLSEAEKEYKKYIKELENWKEIRKSIVGNELTEDTFIYLNKRYKKVSKNIKEELDKCKKVRMEIIDALYEIKIKKVNVYKELYKPVIECINKFNSVNEFCFKVNIDISKNFSSVFLKYINQSISSPFKGKVDGDKYVKEIIQKYNFNIKDDVKKFIAVILADLTKDAYDDYSKYEKLLMDAEIFNYLTNMNYIDVNYEIELWNRPMNNLSPGEKGLLLLIFYLVLDKSKIPLIIDQPEDNLDNQSIYEKLVPYIIETKKTRQVIMVTHNPNLAVACDSEQIIYSCMNKETNKIEHLSGSLENEEINKKIVDVLEGTIKAFNIRENKYYK